MIISQMAQSCFRMQRNLKIRNCLLTAMTCSAFIGECLITHQNPEEGKGKFSHLEPLL